MNRDKIIYYLLLFVTYILIVSEKTVSLSLVATILIFMSISLALNIIENLRINLALNILSIIFIYIFKDQIDKYSIFLPYFLIHLTSIINKMINIENKETIYILGLFPAILFERIDAILYFLVYFISYLVFIKSEIYKDRILDKEKMLIELENKNIKLVEKVNKNSEFSKQLESLSRIDERNRISQKIHDMLGHSLSGALMQIEASKFILSSDAQKGMNMLESSTKIIREGIDSIRKVLREDKPDINEIGLNEIKLLLEKVQKDNNIKTHLEVKGDFKLVRTESLKIIYSNIEEALSNSVKYSFADNIYVGIYIFNKIIKLIISDDGIGVDKIERGMGIKGMEERALKDGGSVSIDTSRGFKITTLLPIGEIVKND